MKSLRLLPMQHVIMGGMTCVFCAMCNAHYHESCMGKGAYAWPLLRTRVSYSDENFIGAY